MEGGSDDEEAKEAKNGAAVDIGDIQMEEMNAPTNEPDVADQQVHDNRNPTKTL